MDQPKSVTFSCILYRGLLRFGPAAFRREYQSLLLSDFRQQCLTTYRQRGWMGVLSLWPTHLMFTFRDLTSEQVSTAWVEIMKRWSSMLLFSVRSLNKSKTRQTSLSTRFVLGDKKSGKEQFKQLSFSDWLVEDAPAITIESYHIVVGDSTLGKPRNL